MAVLSSALILDVIPAMSESKSLPEYMSLKVCCAPNGLVPKLYCAAWLSQLGIAFAICLSLAALVGSAILAQGARNV